MLFLETFSSYFGNGFLVCLMDLDWQSFHPSRFTTSCWSQWPHWFDYLPDRPSSSFKKYYCLLYLYSTLHLPMSSTC